jgi:hypothetical protein
MVRYKGIALVKLGTIMEESKTMKIIFNQGLRNFASPYPTIVAKNTELRLATPAIKKLLKNKRGRENV